MSEISDSEFLFPFRKSQLVCVYYFHSKWIMQNDHGKTHGVVAIFQDGIQWSLPSDIHNYGDSLSRVFQGMPEWSWDQ